MSRLALAQLLVFAIVAVACGYYVADRVFGPNATGDPITVTVRMPDTGGLITGSQVTYRGVGVGEVSDVRIARDREGVEVVASLHPRTRVPADTDAVVTMESPVAILRLDFRPDDRSGPYLATGDTVTADRTRRPLPLEALLGDFVRLADTLPTEDVSVLADSLATGLQNATGDLDRILEGTDALLDFGSERTDQLERILESGRLVAETNGSRLRQLASAMRSLSGGLRATAPELRTLVRNVPEPARRVTELIERTEPSLGTLLGNLVTTTRLVGMRGPAVEQLLRSAPKAFHSLGSVVDGDTANFYLVGTQGPVCYNDTPRRAPQRTEPREPQWQWHCTPGQDLNQRGAQHAPRPDAGVPTSSGSDANTDPAPPAGGTHSDPSPDATTHEPATHEPATHETAPHEAATGERAPFTLGTTGGQAAVLGPRSWSSLLLQGVH
ncbi:MULTISPECIES: MlaD family protein [Prauserella salsuginis group]|uniref:MlaD family protein n=1 Tax=Prauserella salsuginis TaxID=387889 RepID=A0ABW6G408_9PSEU|nr:MULTISPECIES: MlaD family protein [Prauserella salsuginis group]MCR3718322.1 phospholipid/cholesterol/gamma-HCH transport system substrate-binding protein [Prauserella flava]MCR3732892.1 phospholipid/cholesterol/gamma-HCH transport system substrate-binding protein [Prauserella salsuginis]